MSKLPTAFKTSSHRRLNILTNEWILVSPQRTQRPWQGKVETLAKTALPPFDEKCYLCPGNTRANGDKNPQYKNTYVFRNDFSALNIDTSESAEYSDGLLKASSEPGICRVVCFSPQHNLTLPEMEEQAIRSVVDIWVEQFQDLSRQNNIHHIQIFENKGDIMGCSNPHPHGQIWAQATVPVEPMKEYHSFKKHFDTTGRSLLSDYLEMETAKNERIVCANDDFVVLVPFWAVWPFETIIISRRHFGCIDDMSNAERDSFANIIRRLTIRYDNIFSISFPYSAGMHQRPVNDGFHPEWHFHMHFYPPLLRSATIKKFVVGYELLANPQRDITAESSAELLRGLSEVHYTKAER